MIRFLRTMLLAKTHMFHPICPVYGVSNRYDSVCPVQTGEYSVGNPQKFPKNIDFLPVCGIIMVVFLAIWESTDYIIERRCV